MARLVLARHTPCISAAQKKDGLKKSNEGQRLYLYDMIYQNKQG